VHWSDVLFSKLSDTVKLVGPTINCEGAPEKGDVAAPWRKNPHVQSYLVATDQVGLSVLLQDQNVFACFEDMSDTIFHSELGSSKVLLDAGYNIDSLMARRPASVPVQLLCASRTATCARVLPSWLLPELDHSALFWCTAAAWLQEHGRLTRVPPRPLAGALPGRRLARQGELGLQLRAQPVRQPLRRRRLARGDGGHVRQGEGAAARAALGVPRQRAALRPVDAGHAAGARARRPLPCCKLPHRNLQTSLAAYILIFSPDILVFGNIVPRSAKTSCRMLCALGWLCWSPGQSARV
jgi:hypothetical protein